MSAAVTTTDSTSTGEPGHFDFAAYLESSRQQVEQALHGLDIGVRRLVEHRGDLAVVKDELKDVELLGGELAQVGV